MRWCCVYPLLVALLSTVSCQDIVFPGEDAPSTVAPVQSTTVSTTPIPPEISTVGHNDTDTDSHIDAVHGLLSRPVDSDKQNDDEKPDLSLSAIGGRAVLPRQGFGCRAPTGEQGSCGTVRECPGIYRIRDSSYLRSFLCGYQSQTPLVCCPTRWTTDYFYGYQKPTTTKAPSYSNNYYGNGNGYGGGNYQQPYYGNNQYNQPSYPRYEYPQPQYNQYPQYPRPVNGFYFSTTSRPAYVETTTTVRTTTKAPKQAEQTGGNGARPRKPDFLPKVCGTASTLTRIVGGNEAAPGSYPWMAAIFVQSGSSWVQACGGALVSNKHVVTAAHCVVSGSRSQNLPTRLFLIRLGDHDLISTDDVPAGSTVDVKVAKISRHSQFNANTYKNDIAIIELETPVTFSKFIQPLCIPYDGVYNNLDNEIAIVTGWGYTKYDGKGSDVLKEAAIRIWPETECKEAFKKEVSISSEYLCAGDGTGKKDSCQGDSGGPLVYQEGAKFYLIGIVSFGKKCATPGYPGAYTRVTKYLDWLNDHY